MIIMNITRQELIILEEKVKEESQVSGKDRLLFEMVNIVVICGILSIFGMATSIINAIIFVKHGLNNTVNISLFSLSVSDFCGLTTLWWFGVSMNPLVVYADTILYSEEIGYITGAFPHSCFSRITCWLTAYITAERCLCIALPLKSKQIITPKRTALILSFIYLWTIALLAPQYAVTCFEWNKDDRRNKTVLRLHFVPELLYLDALSFFLNAYNGTVSFIAVSIFTIILIVKLQQQREWRRSTVTETERNRSNINREKKTGHMVLMISVLLIFCYTPGILASVATFIDDNFRLHRANENEMVVSWSFFFILEAVNSSSNIFFYYKMSTKYKKTFNEMFNLHNKAKDYVK